MGIARTLVALITLYEGLILLRAVLSWFVSPYSTHPVVELLRRLTDPVLEPVRKLLPVSSGIDFSPLIVLLGLELLKRLFS
ncbi:MAG: YggT family protein [Gemmatimonadota bacterium]|nr:YggT family protein [Candidatus Palauibacterales bacterium]